jgi:hypothetical protein
MRPSNPALEAYRFWLCTSTAVSEQVALVRWPAGERFQRHRHFGGEHLPCTEEETLIWVKVGHLPESEV